MDDASYIKKLISQLVYVDLHKVSTRTFSNDIFIEHVSNHNIQFLNFVLVVKIKLNTDNLDFVIIAEEFKKGLNFIFMYLSYHRIGYSSRRKDKQICVMYEIKIYLSTMI